MKNKTMSVVFLKDYDVYDNSTKTTTKYKKNDKASLPHAQALFLFTDLVVELPKVKKIPIQQRVKEFEKFYKLLMQNAPNDYEPHFIPVKKHDKSPDCKVNWKEKSNRLSYNEARYRIKQGSNVGLASLEGDCLILMDFDDPENLHNAPNNTLREKTRRGDGLHIYGFSRDKDLKYNISVTKFGEYRSCNEYVVVSGSYVPTESVPFGGFYFLDNEIPATNLKREDIPKEFYVTPEQLEEMRNNVKKSKTKEPTKNKQKTTTKKDIFDLDFNDLGLGEHQQNARFPHPLHDSDTGSNFSVSGDKKTATCWRCKVSFNPVQFLGAKYELGECLEVGKPHKNSVGEPSIVKGEIFRKIIHLAVKENLIKPPEKEETPETDVNELLSQAEKWEELNITERIELQNKIYGTLVYTKNSNVYIQELKKSTGISKKDWTIGIEDKRKTLPKNPAPKKEMTPLDSKFEDKELLKYVCDEMDKVHKYDNKAKMACALVCASGELVNPKDHMSACFKGDSSSGKDNCMKAGLSLFPEEDSFLLTRGTQSSLEEESANVKRIAFSEINQARDGANSDLTEFFKQLSEGGVNVIKRDKTSNEIIRIQTEQKTLLYATTETEIDAELVTRYVIIPIKSNEAKNKGVVKHYLKQAENPLAVTEKIGEWFKEAIHQLERLPVCIPFASLLENEFNFELDRIKRDVQRMMALTRASAWLHQKQRVIKDGMIYAEPADWYIMQKVFSDFMTQTYNNLDSRYEVIVNKIQEMQGTQSGEILTAGFSNEFLNYAIRIDVCKALGLNAETFKSRIKYLKDENIIETHWDKEVNGKISLLKTSGYQVGIKSVFSRDADTVHLHITHLIPTQNIIDEYKNKQFVKPDLSFLEEKQSKTEKKSNNNNLKIPTKPSPSENLAVHAKSFFLKNPNPTEKELLKGIGQKGFDFLNENRFLATHDGGYIATKELHEATK